MSTRERMKKDTDPATLASIRDGTAPAETRRAFALGLLTAASESLAAGPVETQRDMFADSTQGIRTSTIQGSLF